MIESSIDLIRTKNKTDVISIQMSFLIAQTYDNAAVMTKDHTKVYRYKSQTEFVLCLSHSLNWFV